MAFLSDIAVLNFRLFLVQSVCFKQFELTKVYKVLNGIIEFLWKYIAGPIIADAQNAETAVWNGITANTGYNLVNTVSWGIIAVGVILLLRKQFEERDIKLNTSTAINSIPFIVLGGILRFLEDTAIMPFILRPLFITPVIYLLIAAVFIVSLFYASRKASSLGCSRDELFRNIGYVILSPFLALTAYIVFLRADLVLMMLPVILAVAFTGLYYLATRSTDYSNKEYLLVVFSQLFGGAVSMISLSFGYTQKQLLTQAFTSFFGQPGVMILKASIAGLAVYMMESDMEENQIKSIALIVLYSIGLATGLRVLLRLGMGI